MQKLSNPIPLFLDARGMLLDGGQIYVGQPNADPQTNPVTVYWDSALTIAAEQPLRTVGGRIVNGAVPSSVFLAGDDYSMRILDYAGALVDYSPSVYASTDAFQPASPTLTLLAALSTTTFGRSLLALADQAALKTATGIPDPLPKAGGTMAGDIRRQGAGTYLYFTETGLTSGRVFRTANGAADPTSLPGDIWLEEA